MEYSKKIKENEYGSIIWHPEYIVNHNLVFDNYIFEPLDNYPYKNQIRVAVITDIILKEEFQGNYYYAYQLVKAFCEYFENKYDGKIIICTHLDSAKLISKNNKDKKIKSLYSLYTLLKVVYYKADFLIYDIITRCGESVCIYNNKAYSEVYNSYRIKIISKYLSVEEREMNNGLLNPKQI